MVQDIQILNELIQNLWSQSIIRITSRHHWLWIIASKVCSGPHMPTIRTMELVWCCPNFWHSRTWCLRSVKEEEHMVLDVLWTNQVWSTFTPSETQSSNRHMIISKWASRTWLTETLATNKCKSPSFWHSRNLIKYLNQVWKAWSNSAEAILTNTG